MLELHHQAGQDDAVFDVVRRKLHRRLGDDLAAVGDDDHTLAGGEILFDQSGEDQRLAAAGRRHQQHAPLAVSNDAIDFGSSIVLIRPQLAHTALRAFANAAAMQACTISSPTSSTRPDQIAAS
jgi:hypothetical protein